MPDPQNSNRQEAAQFEPEYIDLFEQARDAEALDFASQFDDGAAPAPAVPPENNLVTEAEKAMIGAGRDISLGIMNAPRSAARGFRNGLQNMMEIGRDLDQFFNTPALQIFNETGSFDPAIISSREAADKGLKGIELPDVVKPAIETTTGNLIEGVAQFMTGLRGVDKAIKANALLSGGAQALQGMKGGQFALGVVKGAAADLAAFDEADARLSDVIQSDPRLQNVVTAYLAGDDNDSAAEGKFKQAVEGLTLGAVGDVLFEGIKFLKKGKAAKESIEAAAKSPDDLFDLPPGEQAGIQMSAKDFEFLGDAGSDDLLLRKKAKLDAATDEVKAAFGKHKRVASGAAPGIDDYEINFSRINGPDDIKKLMDDMVNKPELKPSIEAARRSKIDNRTTLTAATDIDGFDSLLARRTGDAFNAETIVAARKVYYDTTEKLMEAARRASGPQASAIDQFNFRRMVATHHAVQKEFMGVRAEAGRALQAWSIPVGGSGAENARALEQILNEFGGVDASQALAKRIADRGNNLNTSQLNAMTAKAASARTSEAVTEAWTLGLLTNPTTHVVNLTSNVLTGLTLGMERLGAAFVKDSPVKLREGSEFFIGMLEAQKAGMKNAAEAFRTGQTGIGISKIDLPRVRATSREMLDPEGKMGVFSKAIDWYGHFLQKNVGGALAAGDEYGKTVLYNAQLRALAVRDAIAQGMDEAGVKAHVASVLAEPPAYLRADALDFANYGTFTKELGSVGQSLQRGIAKYPLLRFVLPFVRTPVNIFKFTYERTPLAVLSQKVRSDISAGGARKAAALSKIGMGTTILAIGNDLAMNGRITGAGPSDPDTKAALRRTGWQPYSVKIGDTYYSYARFEPVATLLGMSADLAEVLSNYEAYDIDAQKQADELVTAMAIAAGNQVVGKTFLQGFADLTEVLSDPGRYGERYLQRFAGSVVPAGVAAVERAVDPTTSQVFSMIDQIKARIPGMSGSVIPRRNIWGEPIKAFYPEDSTLAGATAERLMSLFSPVYYSAEKDAPVDAWMLENGFEIRMPQKTQSFEGVKIDLREYPKIYDRLIELRGNALELQKYGNQSMREFFDNLVQEDDPFGRHVGFFMSAGNDYDDQQNFIDQVVRDYTAGAKEQLMQEFPEISDIVGRERRRAEKMKAVRPSLLEQQQGGP